MRMQKRWWLGFVSLVGVYYFPRVIAVFNGDGQTWEWIYLTWFIWLLYFVPERVKGPGPSNGKSSDGDAR